MGTPEREEREKGSESVFKEIKTEKFPNLGRKLEIHFQVAEAHLIISTQKDLLQNTVYLNYQSQQ